MKESAVYFIDCTLRDGGYYNDWDFSTEIINDYLKAMQAAGVNYTELGFRSLKSDGFLGACAYTSDDFVRSLVIPEGLAVGVMVNASEVLVEGVLSTNNLLRLFPEDASCSTIKLVRIASHVHEFEEALKACSWLKEKGFVVGLNLMQIADCTSDEIVSLTVKASAYPVDVLYFADSMGSMDQQKTTKIIQLFRKNWRGNLGIHAHDNMGLALSNTICAINNGVTWVDSTVTGMGRGPGNAKTEYLAVEVAELRQKKSKLIPLLSLITQYFSPMQKKFRWGTNTYYYLAGKYSIHPTYIQAMLADSRYSEEDILAVIEHLCTNGGKRFSLNALDTARHFYQGTPRGTWNSGKLFDGKEVMLLGSGPGVATHRAALEAYIKKAKPLVMALNTQTQIATELISVHIACHPVRLLADCEAHTKLPQPLITPASMLPADVRDALGPKKLLDFGIGIKLNTFDFSSEHCILPNSLVVAYALAVATSGKSYRILLAGFDGYSADDPRRNEGDKTFSDYQNSKNPIPLLSVTPTLYNLPTTSIYALNIVGY